MLLSMSAWWTREFWIKISSIFSLEELSRYFISRIWAYCFSSIGSSRNGWLLSKSKSSRYQSSGPMVWEALILLVQLRSMSPGSKLLLLLMEVMLIYSGCCWSRLDGEMQETERDLNLVWSDLVWLPPLDDEAAPPDFLLFSLLEFLDLDCWDLFLFLACLGSPLISVEEWVQIRCNHTRQRHVQKRKTATENWSKHSFTMISFHSLSRNEVQCFAGCIFCFCNFQLRHWHVWSKEKCFSSPWPVSIIFMQNWKNI